MHVQKDQDLPMVFSAFCEAVKFVRLPGLLFIFFGIESDVLISDDHQVLDKDTAGLFHSFFR
jgi:hypothetical protein